MKTKIRIKRESLLERVREVAASDEATYQARRADALENVAKLRTSKVQELRDEITKLVAMTAEEYGRYDYRCHLPQKKDHDSVIRALEMGADDILTVDLESDLGRYLK